VSAIADDGADNFSMEVHLGGENSRHASEISSVSYQNLLEEGDTTSASVLSRRGSEDSNDSYPADFENELPPDDMETFEASDLPLSEHYTSWKMKQAARATQPSVEAASNDLSPAHTKAASPIGVADRRRERSSEGRRNGNLGGADNANPDVALSRKTQHSLNVSDTSSQDPSAILRRKKSPQPSGVPADDSGGTKKRNSLEIRNNIPVVGEVKVVDSSSNGSPQPSHSIKPKIKNLKQSPGLARRIEDDPIRDGSSSEREVEISVQGDPAATFPSGVEQEKKDCTERMIDSGKMEVIAPLRRNIDIENEYDYVKYARVQHGNSYVGMRLAYSSSNDSLSLKRNSLQSHGSDSMDSSREPSPEKVLHQKILSDLNGHAAQERVCEDTLTEIPLNSDYGQHEGHKPFTLSPEATECDSVEVESVTSDGENSIPGFPTVEDGLSSSQGSDVEDTAGMDLNSPSHRLRMKQKANVDQEMTKSSEDEVGS
jgi:hypothetical protein